MPNQFHYDTIHKMYISYYQRPADPLGLEYWVRQYEDSGNWNNIAGAFSSAPESQALYGDATIEQQIAMIYEAALEREPEPGAIQWWVDTGYSAAEIAFAIVSGAQGEDLATVDNKVLYSSFFVGVIDPNDTAASTQMNADGTLVNPNDYRPAHQYGGNDDAATGRELMGAVTASTVVNEANVDSDVNEYFTDSDGEISLDGQTEVSGINGQEDIFVLSFDSSTGSMVSTGTQVTINNFTVGEDTLKFSDSNAGPPDEQDFFAAGTGIMTTNDPFSNATLIDFRPQAPDDFDPAPSSITLVGVSNQDSAGSNQIDVADLTAANDGTPIYEIAFQVT